LYGVVIACVYICPKHPWYVRSSGTRNVQFPRILATSIHTPRRCLVILCNCLKAARNITGHLLICILNIYHHESGNSALPDMSGLVDQSGASVWNRGTGAAVSQLPVRSASFPFILIISRNYLASQFG
ncbi:hypothetical protein T07_11048, partial [Trichinella nelsoni]